MDNNENLIVIIEIGSGYVKAGTVEEQWPRAVFPCVVGRPKMPGIMVGMDNKDCYIGEEALAKRGVLAIKYPVEHGIVTNWDDFQQILHHVFYNELRVTPEESNVIITEAPLNPKANREKLTQILFETFNVPAAYILNTAVASLHGYGKTTGLVVESGDGVTHVVPVVNGHAVSQAILRLDLGGRDLTDYLVVLLAEIGESFTTSAEREIVRDIKEKLCYVAVDFEEERIKYAESSVHDVVYELPDGNTVNFGNQRFRAPEALFKPSIIGKESAGLHQLVYEAIMKSDAGVRHDLCANIVLSGGSMLFPGMKERLTAELKKLLSSDLAASVNIELMPNANYAAFLGGVNLLNNPDFASSWITSEEFDQVGPRIVHQKCMLQGVIIDEISQE